MVIENCAGRLGKSPVGLFTVVTAGENIIASDGPGVGLGVGAGVAVAVGVAGLDELSPPQPKSMQARRAGLITLK
jgi:hypothetical protein